uniref:Neprosin PEP catalytic domain-containing protein n=1 Tax=Oryza brachyantha TaxID=4533 RepID=J3N5S6_ORYBR
MESSPEVRKPSRGESGRKAMAAATIAAAYGVSGPYHGASAWIPIWKTAVEPSEFSKSYLLIASPSVRDFVPIRGKDPPNTDNQVAVGIAVYSKYFGDDFPRLYIYSTVKCLCSIPLATYMHTITILLNDAGVKLKCFNLECPFVQTSNKFAIGGRFVNFSTVGGTLYGSHIIIYRDAGPSVWWVSLMDEAIGYFREWVPGAVHRELPQRDGWACAGQPAGPHAHPHEERDVPLGRPPQRCRHRLHRRRPGRRPREQHRHPPQGPAPSWHRCRLRWSRGIRLRCQL